MAFSPVVSSYLSSITSTFDSSIYTNYVNVYFSIPKLDDTIYEIWASYVKLWLKSQRYVDHISQNVSTIGFVAVTRWLKIDAQLCINSSLKQPFYSYKTCFEIW